MKSTLIFGVLVALIAIAMANPHGDHKDDHSHAPNEPHTAGHTHHSASEAGHDHKRKCVCVCVNCHPE